MTCHSKGIEILTDNSIPKGDNSDGMNNIGRQRFAMQNKGLANETLTVGFSNSNGNKAIAAGDVSSMDGSVGATAAAATGDSDNSVFGVSMADGYHTMTLTVTQEILNGPTENGKPLMGYSFTISDQGTNSGTERKGNFTFSSGAQLDQHLTEYIQNSAPSNFPAKIDLHQIINPN